jgi:hypothetical protein
MLEIGRKATEILLDKIRRNEEAFQQVVLKPRLNHPQQHLCVSRKIIGSFAGFCFIRKASLFFKNPRVTFSLQKMP